MKKRVKVSVIIYVLGLALLLAWMLGLFRNDDGKLTYSALVDLFHKEQVQAFVVEDHTMSLVLTPEAGGQKLTAELADPEGFRQQLQPLFDQQYQDGILLSYDFIPGPAFSPYDLVIPMILAGLVLLVVWVILAGRANRGNANAMNDFGKSRARVHSPKKKVTFKDVAGVEEEKEELRQVVDFLRDPEKYTRMGAKVPHGILLSGAPGTGKTLLARAVAGEADVAFLSISGSDFVELYVGVGASRVRDLFEKARKMAPSIIFIDEIDAVGRRRGSGMGGGHDEREQTLNQLLVEMDGFDSADGVIVMAATNRPDILDPALLRPGRFDRKVEIGRPDAKGREEILKIHAKGKHLDDSVQLRTVAMATAGFTGADLSNLMNEAAIEAVQAGRPALSMKDLNSAMMKILAGPEKRSRVQLQKDLRITAYHEAGHAIAMYRLPTHDPVHHITIIPRGNSLGATWTMPRQDAAHMTRNEMYEAIVGLLGGRVAEAVFLSDISTGASNDIDRATKLARDMVARYGMCEKLGTISYTGGDEIFVGRDYEKTKSYSEKVAGTIDDEVKVLMDRAYDHCKKLLEADAQKLQEVVDYLMAHESMTGEQFAACMEGKPIGQVSDTSMFDDYRENS